MKLRLILPALLLLASYCHGQALQMIPADTPENCPARSKFMEKWLRDWSQLGRYQQADSDLPPVKPGENRIVFLGDSITDGWNLAQYFPGKPYINRGISAQTTANMLLRFRQDVIALKPKAVVILAGTNDIAGNTGPMTVEQIADNLASIAELARVHGITVVFASVTPVNDYTPKSQRFFGERPMTQIIALNKWLRNYADTNGYVYLDYFSSMVDDKGLLKREFAEDGLHPNAAGYQVMATLAEAAVQKALQVPAAASGKN
jgi:lysophospholipase L1-like esterase